MSSTMLRSAFRLNRGIFLARSFQTSSRIICVKRELKSQLPFPFGVIGQFTSPVLRQLSTKVEEAEERHSRNEDPLQRVKSQISQYGYVNFETFSKLLSQPITLTGENYLFLFDCCANYLPTQTRSNRILVFNEIWERLKAENLLTKPHYIAALQVFQANRMPMRNFRTFLDESQLGNNQQIHEDLVYLSCEFGDMKQATEILADMKEKKFTLTEKVFNSLILGHSRKQDLEKSEAVLETMNAAGLLPSSDTYFELLRAYIENGEHSKAITILNQQSLTTSHIVKILKTAALRHLHDIIDLSVKQLPTEMLTTIDLPQQVKLLCTELIFSHNPDEAMMIVNAFPKPNFNENQDTDSFAVFLIQNLIKSGTDAPKIIEICLQLRESEKNSRALHIATEISLRINSSDSIAYLQALSEIEKLRIHYFWPLLIRNFQTKGENGVLSTLKEMQKLEVNCDFETLSFYVLPRLSITLDNEIEAMKGLEKCGLKPSQILTPLISHLIAQQKVDGALNLCSTYPTKLDTSLFVTPLVQLATYLRASKNYFKFSKLMKFLCEKSENPKFDLAGQVLLEITSSKGFGQNPFIVCQIVKDLQKAQVNISPIAADVVNGYLSKFDESDTFKETRNLLQRVVGRSLNLPAAENSSLHIIHPRDMTMEQLEYHLIELQSKGMNARGVLRRLLQLCVRDGRLERALQVKAQCDKLKVQVSPGMMASVFDMYIKLKDLKMAEKTCNEIKTTFPGFQIDEHKIIDFAALLIVKNKIDEAKNLLSDRADATKIVGGDYVTKNIWNLLTNVATISAKTSPSDGPNLTKEFFQFLQSLRYCRAPNTLIGPIVREYILRKDVKQAIEEFKNACEKYRRTPLQMEILSMLVRLSNNKDNEEYNITTDEAKLYLQEVTAAITKVHGPVGLNSTLLLAVAECGTENQLRKLLINPEFRINQEALVKNCEHMSSSGRIETLYRLARACRGLGHVVKEQDIYNLLITTFAKENNCSAALELFKRLEDDDDLKISQDFVNNLVKLLKINNMEIPAEVALKAQLMS